MTPTGYRFGRWMRHFLGLVVATIAIGPATAAADRAVAPTELLQKPTTLTLERDGDELVLSIGEGGVGWVALNTLTGRDSESAVLFYAGDDRHLCAQARPDGIERCWRFTNTRYGLEARRRDGVVYTDAARSSGSSLPRTRFVYPLDITWDDHGRGAGRMAFIPAPADGSFDLRESTVFTLSRPDGSRCAGLLATSVWQGRDGSAVLSCPENGGVFSIRSR